jgi:hypothetical protein
MRCWWSYNNFGTVTTTCRVKAIEHFDAPIFKLGEPYVEEGCTCSLCNRNRELRSIAEPDSERYKFIDWSGKDTAIYRNFLTGSHFSVTVLEEHVRIGKTFTYPPKWSIL